MGKLCGAGWKERDREGVRRVGKESPVDNVLRLFTSAVRKSRKEKVKSETKSRLVTINKYYIRIIKAAMFVGLDAFISDVTFLRLGWGFMLFLGSLILCLRHSDSFLDEKNSL